VLALVVALAIAGCGGDDGDETSTTHAATTPVHDPSQGGKAASKKSQPTARSKKHQSKKAGSSGKADSPKKGGSVNKPTQPAAPPAGKPVGTVPPGAGPAADADAVARTVRAYLVAIARGDGPQACAQLTPEAQHAVERKVARAAPETKGSPCDASIALYQSTYRGAAGGVRVTDVRVAGDRAQAVALHKAASLVKHDRTWLIARYAL